MSNFTGNIAASVPLNYMKRFTTQISSLEETQFKTTLPAEHHPQVTYLLVVMGSVRLTLSPSEEKIQRS